MTDKRKKRARELKQKTGMKHQAAVNVLADARDPALCFCGHARGHHPGGGACDWIGVPDHRPILGLPEELRAEARAHLIPMKCPCGGFTEIEGLIRKPDRPWTQPLRVALLTYSLVCQDPSLHKPLADRSAHDAIRNARQLGWDRSCPVVGFVYPVPEAWIRAVQAKAGFKTEHAHPIAGFSVANPDASREDLHAAAHLSCLALLGFQEDRWGIDSGVPLVPPEGFEHTNTLPEACGLLVQRGVLYTSGPEVDFMHALRDSFSGAGRPWRHADSPAPVEA